MKKQVFFLCAVLALSGAGKVFAQSDGDGSGGVKNWLSGEAGFSGFGVRYERMLSDTFSVGATGFINSALFFWNSFGLQASGRYYPWAGNFYLELGLGAGVITGGVGIYLADEWYYTVGGMVTPGLGWKIDVGKPGGFFINPMISVPVVFGKGTPAIGYITEEGYTEEFIIGTNFRLAFGMGGAF